MNNESQTDRAVDLWRAIVQTKRIVDLFVGLFDVIGITIEETGEELTARIGADQIHIDPGLPDNYDFLVPLKLENVHDMISFTADGKLDEFEVWRIIAVLFTPLTRETLGNPVMSRNLLRKLAGIEDLIHVQLLGPEAEHVANVVRGLTPLSCVMHSTQYTPLVRVAITPYFRRRLAASEST